jgi:segregation and condensation protein A
VTDYRVDLPNFSGPMDLLLHLVKQQEVDLHEISILRILEGYMVYLKALETLDLNNIGEFVVMASTLMEIKSRELIPREDVDLSEELDPRDELIQQLLEYQRYREITLRLEERGQDREQLVPRGSFGADTREIKELADEERDKEIEESLDMEDLDVWFLLKAYHKLLEETEFGKSFTVEADKKPMAVYLDELIERLTPPETWKPRGCGRALRAALPRAL